MANELSVQAQLAWANGSRSVSRSVSSRFDVSGDNPVVLFPGATTSWATLSLPSNFGTPGWALIRNLSATNNVNIGNNNSGSPVLFTTLQPGEFFQGPLGMAKDQIAVQTNAGTADLECIILER